MGQIADATIDEPVESADDRAADVTLLRHLRTGDGTALGALLDRHGPALYRFVFRLSGSREDAEEVVQDAFLRLFQRPPLPSNGREDLGGWLRVVAARLASNLRRSERRRQSREDSVAVLEGALGTVSRLAEDPSVMLERAEERHRVRSALQRLTERQRQILLMRYSGYRYAEIAEALGINPKSVGTLLVRAERDFQTAYAEEEA